MFLALGWLYLIGSEGLNVLGLFLIFKLVNHSYALDVSDKTKLTRSVLGNCRKSDVDLIANVCNLKKVAGKTLRSVLGIGNAYITLICASLDGIHLINYLYSRVFFGIVYMRLTHIAKAAH